MISRNSGELAQSFPEETVMEEGCTRTKIIKSIWEISTSLWLLGDMTLDIRTTRTYHQKIITDNLPSGFFIASVIAHVTPVIGIVLVAWLYFFNKIRRPEGKHYFQTIIFTIFSPVIWVLTPFLVLVVALLGAGGIDATSNHRINDSGSRFRRFIAYVLIVKGIEQFFEALPQMIISSVYIDTYGIEDNIITLISCITSSGSLLFFLTKHVYDVVTDFDKSLIGIIAADWK